MVKVSTDAFLMEGFEDSYNCSYDSYLMDYQFAKEELYRVYKECLMSKKEVKEQSIENLVMGNGFLSDVAFSADRLEKSSEKIVYIIDTLYTEDDPFFGFSKMDCGTIGYEDGELKPFVDEEAEMLTQLGTAIGEVFILQKPDSFDDEGTLYAIRGESTGKINCKKISSNS